MTRYVIGDIHGGAKTFRALLDKINLRLEDRLYLLGDYVDRGPNSKGVLDIILQLLESGHDVLPIRGNHDEMLLHSAIGRDNEYSQYWMEGWGEYALKSFGVSLPADVPFRYITLIESMPYIRYDNQFVFVHAGLDFKTSDPLTNSSIETMLWERMGTADITRLGGRKLVTGHTITALPLIKESITQNHILLDNGAFTNQQPHFGNLIALNLDNSDLIIQPWCDE